MLLGIDHLVVAVRDPDAAATRLERAVGLAFTGGGRHEHAGTFNRLAFLGDTSLELIGVFDRGLVLGSPFAVGRAALALLDAGREGLATYALASDDIERDVRALWAEGSRIGEPVAGSRVRPDGGVVRWVTAFPGLGPDRPPFLIEHEHAGAEWCDDGRPRLRRGRPIGHRRPGDPAAARRRGAAGRTPGGGARNPGAGPRPHWDPLDPTVGARVPPGAPDGAGAARRARPVVPRHPPSTSRPGT